MRAAWGAVAGVLLWLGLIVITYGRARSRRRLDPYAGLPPVRVIPSRPDRRALGER